MRLNHLGSPLAEYLFGIHVQNLMLLDFDQVLLVNSPARDDFLFEALVCHFIEVFVALGSIGFMALLSEFGSFDTDAVRHLEGVHTVCFLPLLVLFNHEDFGRVLVVDVELAGFVELLVIADLACILFVGEVVV